jgi:hypothetical protein
VKKAGKTINIYGASTKGNVLLQFFGVDNHIVSYAMDKNPGKFCCWTPRTHILIVSEEFSRSMNPDYYLVLPWHFRKGFIEQEQEYLKGGGHLIFSLPNLEVVSMKGGKLVVRPI